MLKRRDLKIGGYYWIMPENDPDVRCPSFPRQDADGVWHNVEHFWNSPQPAMFLGYEGGVPFWTLLGLGENVSEAVDCPIDWVGDEIVRPDAPPTL